MMTISSISTRFSGRSYLIYDVTFYNDTIKTLVTDTPCIVDTWISDIEHLHRQSLHNLIVGLDIEWRPNSDRGMPPPPTAILQLCVGSNCLIFQLLFAPGLPQSLRNFLGKYTFVGVGIDSDIERLYKEYGLIVPNMVDLPELAARELNKDHLRQMGLVRLSREILQKDFPKPKRVSWSNWDSSCLSEDQIQYACLDAFVSYELGRCLNAVAEGRPIRESRRP